MSHLLKIGRTSLVSGVVFLLVTIIAVAASFYVHTVEREEIRREFAQSAINRAVAVQRQYELSIAAIDLVGTLFDTDEQVVESEFERFADPILKRNPAISALSYAPRLRYVDRPEFEKEASARHPDFRITERKEQGKMIPATPREAYVPVRFLVPMRGNEAALGFDLASDAMRNAALTEAGRLNEISATTPLVLVQETGSKYSFLLVRPIYARGAPVESAAREKGLIGYVTAVVRSDTLISSALLHLLPAGIDFSVSDVSNREQPAFLGLHRSRAPLPSNLGPAGEQNRNLSLARTFVAAGRQYLVELSPAPGYFTYSISAASWTLLIAGLAFGLALATFVWLLQDSDRRLRENAFTLQRLSERLIQVQEEERAKLSRELHDEVGQAITALQLNLHALRDSEYGKHANKLLDDCNNIIGRIVQQVRVITLDLRPPMLDDLGLDAALRWHLRRQAERAGLDLRYHFDATIRRLPKPVEIAAYRLAQEGLTNIVRHAEASTVEVRVWQENNQLFIRICDDGRGITGNDAASEPSLGLRGLSERANLAGGTLSVGPGTDGGTCLTARFRLDGDQSKPQELA